MITAAAVAAQVRSGDVSAGDIVEDHLQRAVTSTLNAFTEVQDDGAHARAAEIDAQVKAGKDPGPLAGVPIAIKDLIDQKGFITTCGSSFYRERPETSSIVVERLERAGAIIIGRTGLHEFAFGFSSENHWFGPVRNPWNEATSPGGSSGGSAAAVAGGIVPISIGTDTGGSVRVPAAMCGIVGLKVTHGRVPLTGVVPLASSVDTVGPLATTVEDAELVFRALAGDDPRDPWSVPQRVDATPEVSIDGLRIAVPQPWVAAAPMTDEVASAFDGALDSLAALGATVEHVEAPSIEYPGQINASLYPEVAAVHREWFQDPDLEYGPDVGARLAAAFEVGPDEHVRAQRWRAGLTHAMSRILQTHDVALTPATGATRKVIGEEMLITRNGEMSYRPVLSCFSAIINQAGLPALAVPLAAPGNPAPSIQIIGPQWAEPTLLAVGGAFEAAGLVEVRLP